MYHVVASDLDGTLLSPDHTLSPFTRQTLQLMTEQGVRFVFATGRHHIDVAQIRDRLGIDAFMITSNGARVHNIQDELILSHNMEPEIARELASVLHDHPLVSTHIYRNDEWLVNRESPDEQDFFQESVFNYQLYDQPDRLDTNGIAKFFFTSPDHPLLVDLEQRLNRRWGQRINASFSLPGCLEVMAGGVSKGHALEEVARLKGVTLQQCIAFGDGMNDREMLAMAGKGCIMRNAHPRLKQALPELEVIGSNEDDAVAYYLRGMYL